MIILGAMKGGGPIRESRTENSLAISAGFQKREEYLVEGPTPSGQEARLRVNREQ